MSFSKFVAPTIIIYISKVAISTNYYSLSHSLIRMLVSARSIQRFIPGRNPLRSQTKDFFLALIISNQFVVLS